MEIASYYHVNNLVGIVDINRLGQSGETDLGWDVETYKKRIATFGWRVIEIKNGHNLKEIHEAFTKATEPTSIHTQKPVMILAHTVKGKGVPFMEDKMGWHGKPVPQDRLQEALKAIGSYDKKVKGIIAMPPVVDFKIQKETKKILDRLSASIDSTNTVVGGTGERVPDSTELRPSRRSTGGNESRGRIYDASALVATREAFGDALADLGSSDNRVVALDAEVGNSTYTERLKKTNPSHFLEMFIDEENMISVALGISKIGYVPYLSTFAAFLTRAFDQIRMAQYSLLSPISNLQSPISLNIIGSHAGCSIGADGVSQMGLEDIAMMRSIRESTVLYPADAVSAYKLTQAMATRTGINYLRTTREKTPIIYGPREEFPIGGCKLHYAPDLHSPITNHQSPITNYDAVIIAAGITLHEALKAQKILEKQGKHTIVVDLYSVKPLDSVSIIRIIETAKQVIVVEDHYAAGGIGEAVLSALSYFRFRISDLRFTHLCVRKEPRSGTTEELLRYEGIDAEAIMQSLLVKLTFAA
jgi:transketolase